MTKLTTSLIAFLVFMATIAVPPARADNTASGDTFEIGLIGLQDSYPQGAPITVTVGIHVFPDGTSTRKPVTFTSWIETPLGRASLGTRTRMVMPGQDLRFNITYGTSTAVSSSVPQVDHPPIPVTIGVTVKLKREILDVVASTSILPASTPTP